MSGFALYHDSRSEKYRTPFGAVPVGETVALSLKITAQYTFTGVLNASVHVDADTVCGKQCFDVPMRKQSFLQEGCVESVFSAALDCFLTPGVYFYYFTIWEGDKANTFYYGNNQEGTGGMGEVYRENPVGFQITVYEKNLTVPEWLTDAVFYQIFPDRFASSGQIDPENCGRVNGPIRRYESWDAIPYYEKDENGDIQVWDFMGGDLYGAAEKLPYVSALGVNAVYLNPIFEAASNHRYDTADYRKIDPLLGGDAAFEALLAAARQNGIKVILDGVFSHTGCDSIYFDRYGNYGGGGAYHNPASRYRSWYRFQADCDDEYACWWGCKALPEVTEMNPDYLSYIVTGADSVLNYWFQKGAAGFRLDVADELPDSFLRAIQHCATTQPDGEKRVLIGEVWEDASNKISYGVRRQYFTTAELHSVTNYVFRNGLTDFLTGKISVQMLWARLLSLYENYPRHNFYAALNMTGSHDVERLFTIFLKASAGDRKKACGLHFAYAAVLFTFPGVPMVYYGDETCLEGGMDPDNRRPYPWGREDWAMIRSFSALAHLRQSLAVLRRGSFRMLTPMVDGDAAADIFAFERYFTAGTDVFGRLAPSDGETDSVVCIVSRAPVCFTDVCLRSLLPGARYASWRDHAEYTVDGAGCLNLQLEDIVILQRIMYNE